MIDQENKNLEARILKNAQQQKSNKPAQPIAYTPPAPTGGPTIEVKLVSANKTVLETKTVHTSKGRIPIRDLCRQWNLTNPIWVELEDPIGEMPDGYSDVAFDGIQRVSITGKIN